MKKTLILLSLLLLLASCEEVVYPEPQPPRVRALKEIPDQLQGVYLDESLDTLVIGRHSFIYHLEPLFDVEEEFLSDSNVLKSYKGKYFYSKRIMVEEKTYWLTYLLDQDGSTGNIDAYTMSAEDVVKMAMLQEITSKVADLGPDNDKYYLFAPKKRHYKKIIRDSVFSKLATFSKISGN